MKLSPDLGVEAAAEVVDLALELGLAGLVISNTTLARDGLAAPAELAGHEGGLSGRPLRDRSTDMVRRARARAGDRLGIIGVGGVFNADDAWQKLAAGADLVQIYTGLIYRRPRHGAPHRAGHPAAHGPRGTDDSARLIAGPPRGGRSASVAGPEVAGGAWRCTALDPAGPMFPELGGRWKKPSP